MNKILQDIIVLLELLNIKLKVSLLSKKEIADIKEEIEEFKYDLSKLQETIATAEKIKKPEEYAEVIAHLYQYFGDVIQDLENIHEIITIAVKQYAQKFLNE